MPVPCLGRATFTETNLEGIKCTKAISNIYRHSSYNAVLLYRGIPSNAVFSKPKTSLKFYLTRFFQKKNCKKKKFFLKFFFLKKLAGACSAHYQNMCNVHACAVEKPRTLKVWEMETLKAKTPRVQLTPLCLQKRLREFKINFPTKLNTKQFYKN